MLTNSRTKRVKIISVLGGVGAAALMALGVGQQRAQATLTLVPIGITGYNQDLIVPNTATATGNGGTNFSGDVTAIFGGGANSSIGDYFYENGLSGSASGSGMPASGQIAYSGSSNFSATYQLGSYTSDNVLLLNSSGVGSGVSTASLTLPSGKYSDLSVLDTSGYANSNSVGAVALSLLTASNTTETVTTDYGAPDWFSNSTGGTTADGNSYSNVVYLGGWIQNNAGFKTSPNPELYQSFLNLEDLSGYVNGSASLSTGLNLANDSLQSLTFTVISNGIGTDNAQTAIFAVSGTPVPEPSVVALLGVAGAGLLLLRRSRGLT